MRGWVFGAFGEASPDVHDFVRMCGDIGAARGWRDMGAASVVEAKGVLTGRARRHLGIAAVRSHARLMLDRMASVTGDVEAGARRRAQSKARWARDRWENYMRGGPRAYVPNGRAGRGFFGG